MIISVLDQLIPEGVNVSESAIHKSIRKLIEDMGSDIIEERAVNYIIREIHNGRSLSSVLNDSYIKNRLDEEKMGHVLENEEVVKAVEEEINAAFKNKDFKFTDE